MAEAAQAAPTIAGMANGPEDVITDWPSIDWREVEGHVRRLRQRIFTASQAGDLAKVRNLQKLMLRSRANTLVSVRRVTELNAGRTTAGIDGKIVLLPQGKAALADWVQHDAAPWKPRAVKRVYIAKANGRQRPLGIPVIADRCLQALTLNALEPEWEARLEPKVYGFRPGRGCHDAIVAIHTTANGKNAKRLWVLDADLKAAFDRIDHDHLLTSLGTFPGKGMIAGWLKAGVVEKGWFTPTMEGTPQGGVISPALLNIALHGMGEAAGVRYQALGSDAAILARASPALVVYADDFLALCHSQEQAEEVKARLAAWLAPRGLAFNEDKTSIVHLNEGCDFLGFTIRRHRGKLLTKPSNAALRRIRERLATEMLALRGANADAVIAKLNPIIKGWAAYYRIGVSKRAFNSLDAYAWKLAYKWAKFSHPNKPIRWVTARYFGVFNPFRRDKWVFGDRASGFYLYKFAWTPIVRHRMVPGTASTDDPALAEFWAKRRRRSRLPLGKGTLHLLQKQDGQCSLCGGLLLHADQEPQTPHQWEQWLKVTRTAIRKHAIIADAGNGKPDKPATPRLDHTHCHRRLTTHAGKPALLTAREPPGLA
ncbi:reverse transcriptase domain-containing protein [Streptomyces sp. NPDC059985]|uniref:reverse transcriptase domain-containing protein n=1 Tax=Streptomyces sp. NPDC059985 TaxID=3347025 RepID=UPI0036A0AE10